MNICFVTTEFVSEPTDFDGGLANYVYKISKALTERNHNVLVLVQSYQDKKFKYNGITVQRVKVDYNNLFYKVIKKFLNRGEDLDWIWGSYLLNKRLKQIIKNESFDIVQYSSFRATALFSPKNLTTIVRLSSYHPLWSEAMGIKQGSKEDNSMSYLEKKAVKKVSAVFGPSMIIANAMEQAINKKIEIIETLYDIPIDVDWELPINHTFLKEKRYLLFIGKLNKLKGADLIADIVYKLLSKYKDIYFVFAGRDAGYKDLIISNAKEYSNKLIFMDRVEKSKLFSYIKHSYGIVLPSKMDNLPNACIEAMSVGKLVIGTNGASFEQLIDNNISGLLIEPNNSNDLFNKIEVLLNMNFEQRKKIQESALNRIQKLNPDSIVEKTLNFYKKAIKGI